MATAGYSNNYQRVYNDIQYRGKEIAFDNISVEVMKNMILDMIENIGKITTNLFRIDDITSEDKEQICIKFNKFKEYLCIYKSDDSPLNENNSKQFSNLLKNTIVDSYVFLFESYENQINDAYIQVSQRVSNLNGTLNLFHSRFAQVKYMIKFSKIKTGAVLLIGANGSGKSSFASMIKESYGEDITLIHAQKNLFFIDPTNEFSRMDKKRYTRIASSNSIKESKEANVSGGSGPSNIMSAFTRVVSTLINDSIEQEHENSKKNERKETVFEKARKTFIEIFPEINLDFNTIERSIVVEKNGEEYGVNLLSEGEKAVLYYIGCIFLAEDAHYIIIDEPETHLNVNIYNKLWDKLMCVREDCQFVFISHSIDFISSRRNATLMWIQKYSSPHTWKLQVMEEQEDLPRELFVELLGSQKKIVFCEGEGKGSVDYALYSKIFKDYTIFPVGGHYQVRSSVKAFNKMAQFHGNEAMGVIDGDCWTKEEVKLWNADKIQVLAYNEIEMLLLDEEIIMEVLKNNFSEEEVNEKIHSFKEKFFKLIETKKAEILSDWRRHKTNQFLNTYKIKNCKSIEAVIQELDKLKDDFDIKSIDKWYSDHFYSIYSQRDYKQLLKICNLKKTMLAEANNLLDSDYKEKAIFNIGKNVELSNLIKAKCLESVE